MNYNAGITAFGAYVPRNRLQRSAIHAANTWFAPGLKAIAKGERAVANWDEDAITMAVEAARDALTGLDRSTVAAITLASTTAPFADRLNAAVVKEALNLSDDVASADAAGSLRAGVAALIQALKGVSDSNGAHLCVAAELRKARPASEAEMLQGDAAAAILVGRDDPVARFIGSYSRTLDFVDHYRANGEPFDYVWEARWIRDEGYTAIAGNVIGAGLGALGVDPGSIDHAVIAIPTRGVPETLAKRVGIRADAVSDTMMDRVGDSGCAHPLLLLAAALEKASPGERILLVGFGQGVDLAVFVATDALTRLAPRRGVSGALHRGRPDSNYLRFLFHRGLVDLDCGMRAEQDQKQPASALYRDRKAVMALIGGRCTKTGTVQFPQSAISVSSNAPAINTQEDYPLAERPARIVSFTADNLTYSPAPPCYYGMVDFDGGGRITMEFADVVEADVEVGREMRMVFRIKAIDEQRHFKRYFWKAEAVS
jgi:3-hydroxy-3-methylglutaryl CoA synthase/uncharacterized OB-fold protein